jgi:hypothetical protein
MSGLWYKGTSRFARHLDMQYNITLGSQDIGPKIKPNGMSFVGHCFHCGCPDHCQNFCPLKFCCICQQYGHMSKVCEDLKATVRNTRSLGVSVQASSVFMTRQFSQTKSTYSTSSHNCKKHT